MSDNDDMEQPLVAWAVLDMDGKAFHSVHLFSEDAEVAARFLGSVVMLRPAGADSECATAAALREAINRFDAGKASNEGDA